MRKAWIGTIALCAWLGAGGTPAHANWAYTTWNMTPDQVRKASTDPLQDPTDIDQRLRGRGDLQLLLMGTHKMGRYTFDVDFLFFENKLQRVVLYLQDMSLCGALAADLQKNYPKTNIDRSEGALTSREYQDETHFNVLYFYGLPGQKICRLSYSYTLSYGKHAQ